MNNRVLKTIKKYNMLSNGDSVIVALSGGADSVALLSTLNSIKEQLNLTLYSAHLNHNLRGQEAERDEFFCKILCKNYNIPIFTKSVDIRATAKSQKISEELCGRNERYKFFDELSSKLSAKVATAHTASDNAETVLFNLARGTGLNGLGGIAPIRGKIIRPLIEQTRADIESYCAENNLEFVTDSTNLEDDYTRNRIRHRVTPELRELNPRFELAVSNFSDDARAIADLLDRVAEQALSQSAEKYGYNCQKLLSNPPIVTKTAILLLCKNSFGITPERKHIELIYSIISTGGALEISKEWVAVSSQNIFRIVASNAQPNGQNVYISKENCFCYDKKIYTANADNSVLENKHLVFRLRQSGDTFLIPKRNVKKPLRKLMNEKKIPSELRDRLVVLAEGSTVLWCEEIGNSADGDINNIKISVKKGD